MVCLKIDIVSIFFPTRAEGREVSSTCNICHSLLTTLLCFSLYHHFGRVLFNGEESLVVLFLLVSQPGQLGSGKGTCLSVLSLLLPFVRTISFKSSGPSAGLVLRGWMRPEVEGIGSEPNWQRPGIVPRQEPWGFR